MAHPSSKVLVHPGSTAGRSLDNVGIQESSIKGGPRLRNTETVVNTIALKSTTEKADSEGVLDPDNESRRIDTGRDLLNNNAVNVLMAFIMSFGGIAVASLIWGVPVGELFI